MIGILLTMLVATLSVAVLGSLFVQAYRAVTPPSKPFRDMPVSFATLANANERFLL